MNTKWLVDNDPNPNEEQGYANGGAVAWGLIFLFIGIVLLGAWKAFS